MKKQPMVKGKPRKVQDLRPLEKIVDFKGFPEHALPS